MLAKAIRLYGTSNFSKIVPMISSRLREYLVKQEKIFIIFFFVILFFLSCLAFPDAKADDLLKEYIGEWGTTVSFGALCHQPSLPGDVDANEVAAARITSTQLQYPDIGCKISEARASLEYMRAVKVGLDCAGEGYRWSGSEVWRIQVIRGEPFLITAGGPNEEINVYRRCSQIR